MTYDAQLAIEVVHRAKEFLKTERGIFVVVSSVILVLGAYALLARK